MVEDAEAVSGMEEEREVVAWTLARSVEAACRRSLFFAYCRKPILTSLPQLLPLPRHRPPPKFYTQSHRYRTRAVFIRNYLPTSSFQIICHLGTTLRQLEANTISAKLCICNADQDVLPRRSQALAMSSPIRRLVVHRAPCLNHCPTTVSVSRSISAAALVERTRSRSCCARATATSSSYTLLDTWPRLSCWRPIGSCERAWKQAELFKRLLRP